MDKKQIEVMLWQIESLAQSNLISKGVDREIADIWNIVELVRMCEMDTASVPEQKFARDVLELILRFEPNVRPGVFSDEDIRNDMGTKESPWRDDLEMFINPDDLFLNGKIRPDIVFRKGLGNYIIFEVDSFQYHSSQEQLTNDKVRERKIQSLGYPVFRFSAKEILTSPWSSAIEAVKILESKGFIKSKETVV